MQKYRIRYTYLPDSPWISGANLAFFEGQDIISAIKKFQRATPRAHIISVEVVR